MTLIPPEFKNSWMLRLGFAVLGIAAVCFLLLAFNILTIGPCSGNGWYAYFGLFITVPLGFILLFIGVLRLYLRKRKPMKETL